MEATTRFLDLYGPMPLKKDLGGFSALGSSRAASATLSRARVAESCRGHPPLVSCC